MNKKFSQLKVVKILGNKFIIAIIIFFAWLVFFDENSIVNHMKDRRRLNDLVQQKAHFEERIAVDKERYEELHKGKAELEKFAREQYYMSKPDEDVFIVVEED